MCVYVYVCKDIGFTRIILLRLASFMLDRDTTFRHREFKGQGVSMVALVDMGMWVTTIHKSGLRVELITRARWPLSHSWMLECWIELAFPSGPFIDIKVRSSMRLSGGYVCNLLSQISSSSPLSKSLEAPCICCMALHAKIELLYKIAFGEERC